MKFLRMLPVCSMVVSERVCLWRRGISVDRTAPLRPKRLLSRDPLFRAVPFQFLTYAVFIPVKVNGKATVSIFRFDGACLPFRRNITFLTMNRSLQTLVVVFLVTSTALAGANPFIGEWKLDPSKSRMPDEMKVQSQGGNKYAFDFGGATETIAVDGTDQPGYGGTSLSIKAEAPDTWIVERKKDGRSLLKATWKLSK